MSATTVCTNLAGSYCYSSSGPEPLAAASAVRPYLDNAARNWGCAWNQGGQAVVDLGGGSWSKSYGNETDAAAGCGVAYWNRARQAAFFLPRSERGANVAAAGMGATASASSTYNAGTPVASLVDGNRRGNVWASGGGWSSAANPTLANPQWVQVNLNGSRRIQEIVVTTLQDNYAAPIEPTTATTFTTYGIRDFAVQYWSGSGWVAAGSITGNNKVVRRFTFAPVQTTAVRVLVTAALQNFARIVEVEAYEASTTSGRISDRYASARAALGLPVSNPVPYGWTNATYQQFDRGVVTYIRGQASAFAVGGTSAEDKALAEKYAEAFGISPTSGPAVYGLARDPACTSPNGDSCANATGRYVEWRDTYAGADATVVARTGWSSASLVPASIRTAWVNRYGTSPWNGELGFPLTDLLATGDATSHQEFEGGSILWEPSACSSGAYRARIVSQFRRPIANGNLTMLCDAAAPENRTLALPTEPVPFAVEGASGEYVFKSATESGWFSGATVRREGEPAYDVDGPFYSAWIGGAEGGNSVAEALAGGGAGWGLPTGNATCVDEPCTMQMQSFANGIASTSVTSNGVVGWAPSSLNAPTAFGFLARGYAVPPPPADRRTPFTNRSGDFVELVWRDESSDSDVTLSLYRSVTPLNGGAGPFSLIHTVPPPAPPKGTFSFFTDTQAVNNAKNCYFIRVSDGVDSADTDHRCIYTLDGQTLNGVNRSIPRGVSRAQLRITVPSSPDDSATTGPVSARLVAFGNGQEYNFSYLDSPTTAPDFALGTTRTYDLLVTGVEDVSDIVGIVVGSEAKRVGGPIVNDNLRVSRLELVLDNVLAFSKTFDPPFLVSNSGALGGTSLKIGFDELHSNPRWGDVYAASPGGFIGFSKTDFVSKLDGIMATAIFSAPGAAYYGSRLRDGFATAVSKPSGYGQDRLHVRQNVTADANLGIFCSVDYDLRITAEDIGGNPVSPFVNGPAPGIIYTTRIGAENPDVSCGTTFMRKIVYTIFSVGVFPFALSVLDDHMETALGAQSPSQIQSAPPQNLHFCFPGNGQGLGGLDFQNGGLTLCMD
jgi:hypothetical protein